MADSGKKLILDPPAETYGYVLADKSADYVTASHAHKDHGAVDLFPAKALLPQESLALKAGPFSVEGFDCWHDEKQGTLRGSNRVHKITADGVTVVHLGDLGHMPDQALVDFAQNADLLVVPVGGVGVEDKDFELLCQMPVHVDTALITRWMDGQELAEAARRLGNNRILFGSDLPWADYFEVVRLVDQAANYDPDFDREAVCWSNAMALIRTAHRYD